MPDNNKDQFDLGSDFDFAALSEFESDGKAVTAGEPETPEFGEFEASSSEPDFASFAGETQFEDSTENVDFGSQEFEPAGDFAGGGGDFDFGMPPSPQSVELESMSGNPDEEFGDFTGGGDFGGTDDFGGDDAPVDPYAEDDGVPAKGYTSGSSVDPFADDDQDAGQTEADAPEPTANDNSKPGIKHYAGIAAVVAVVGYIGYSQVLPMFVSTDAGQTIVDATPVVTDGNFPVGLPKEGLETPPITQSALPQPDAEPISGATPDALPPIDLSGASETDGKPAPLDNAVVAAAPSIDLPVATPPLESTPVKVDTPVNIDPLDEMVGGKDRGGLDSMKDEAAPVVEASPIANADIATLVSRLDEVVKRIETIEKKVASFGASFDGDTEFKTPVAEAKPSVTLPAVADGGVSAPLKPPIIENVVLRGVSRDIAWIATGKGVVEVKVGDSIEDAGVVESFQNYRGRWIAVTDKGIILPR
jgi:hypothetical protein